MMLEPISLGRLVFALIPAAAVLGLMWRFNAGHGKALYAFARMFVQLLAIGYALVFIFNSKSPALVAAILLIMVLASSWIALNTIKDGKRELFGPSFLSVLGGGGVTLVLVTQGVLAIDPWHDAKVVIPLAGMIFASSMTSISLAAERLAAELANGVAVDPARRTAFHAAMIPIINSLFAVGLVSLPGMMTGQILSGVSPLVAARYQIMVMCMIFGATGLSTASFLYLTRAASAFTKPPPRQETKQ
jgi:putative ABC transport system permease protein